jgi:hypothetical protein
LKKLHLFPDSFQPGQTVVIAITPTLTVTSSGAQRRFDPVRRQCYFEDEIELLHFPPIEGYRLEQNVIEVKVEKCYN